MPWPSLIPFFFAFFSPSLHKYYPSQYAAPHSAFGLYLPQVLLKALMCGSEQSSDAEAVSVLLVSDPRLLQQRVQFLSDVRLHLVMAIALCDRGGEREDTYFKMVESDTS